MKKLIYSIILASFFQSMAFATCFNFVNQTGPLGVGNIEFDNEPAKSICVYKVNTINQRTGLEIKDSKGPVLRVSVREESTGRCGLDTFCKSYQGLSGQDIRGNLSSEDEQSVKLSIKATLRPNLGLKIGTMTDETTGQKYSIIEKK